MATLCSLATRLDQGQLDEIGALEKELGVPVLAFACHQMDPAAIDGDQVAKIAALENKLIVALYDAVAAMDKLDPALIDMADEEQSALWTTYRVLTNETLHADSYLML